MKTLHWKNLLPLAVLAGTLTGCGPARPPHSQTREKS